MTKGNYIIGALFLLCCISSCNKEEQHFYGANSAKPSVSEPEMLVVQFDESVTKSIEARANTKAGLMARTGVSSIDGVFDALSVSSMERVFPDAGEWEERHREAGLHNYYYITYDDSKTVKTKAGQVLSEVSGIVCAQPVPKRVRMEEPIFNDPMLSSQWHYINPGGSRNYVAGADINVLPVWKDYTAGNNPNFDVIVSVVDGGIDLTHPDLSDVILKDLCYNFKKNSSTITAESHGTHVAGTIGAINNNGIGVCGVAGGNDGKGGVKLISCQVFDSEDDYGYGFANAIVYGADHGAVISQNSWGSVYETESDALRGGIPPDEKAAVDYFIKNAGVDKRGNQTGPMKGGVVIFAAGNDGWRIGWPAAYEPIIAVGAISSRGTRSYYSNYGDWVDICAPGGDANIGPQILSTVPGSYGLLQGTSMACPHVSGVAALIVAHFGGPGFTNDMLIERLLKGANNDFLPSDSNIGPLVDAYGSFCYGSKNPPARVDEYEAIGRGGSVQLNWTVGADSDGKPAYAYMICASEKESELTSLNPNKVPASVKTGIKVVEDLKVGDAITGYVDGLEFDKNYYVAIVGYDYGKAFAEVSDVKAVHTTRNNPPVIEEITALPWEVCASRSFTAQIKVYDPDNHYSFASITQKGLKSFKYEDDGNGIYSITVNGVREEAGDYEVTVIAKDSYDATTEKKFVVRVLENRAPVSLKQFDNLIFDKRGVSKSFMVGDFFEDPDGDALTYAVSHSNSKIAHLSILGDELTVTAMSYGLDEITVKASDAKGAASELTFKVAVIDSKADASIYPTQVTDVLYVSGGIEADAEIYVYSSTGALVFHDTMKSSAFNAAKVDMSNCPPGVYTVKVNISGKETSRTIVKL